MAPPYFQPHQHPQLVALMKRILERMQFDLLDALEDALHQRHQLRVLVWLKVRRSHVQSRVTTVATRSRPEILSSVKMGPVAGTISPSLVVAATANKARTAALSQ